VALAFPEPWVAMIIMLIIEKTLLPRLRCRWKLINWAAVVAIVAFPIELQFNCRGNRMSAGFATVKVTNMGHTASFSHSSTYLCLLSICCALGEFPSLESCAVVAATHINCFWHAPLTFMSGDCLWALLLIRAMSWRCWVPVPPFNKEPCQWQTPKLQPQKENFCEIEMLQNILNQIPLALLSLFSSFSTAISSPFPGRNNFLFRSG